MLPTFRFAPIRAVLVVTGLLCAACDRQVDSDFQGESLLRLRGRVQVPLELDTAGLRPVVAVSLRGGPAHLRFTERVLPTVVSGEFPSGFTLDLLEAPPPEAITKAWGGEPEPRIVRGRLLVVGPDFPSTFTWLRHDARPVTDCATDRCHRTTFCEGESWEEDGSISVQTDADIPEGRACISEILACAVREDGPAYRCLETEPQGDLRLRTVGVAERLEFVYFPEPVQAGTLVAFHYNSGEAISPGYHVYLEPEPFDDDMAPVEAPPACEDLTDEFLRRYNEDHGTSHTRRPDFPSEEEDPSGQAQGDYERAVYAVLRERGCPTDSGYRELTADDVIKIALVPHMPDSQ